MNSFALYAVILSSVLFLSGCFQKSSPSQVVTDDVVTTTGDDSAVSTGDTVVEIPVLPTEDSADDTANDPLEDVKDTDFDQKTLQDPEIDNLMDYIDTLLNE